MLLFSDMRGAFGFFGLFLSVLYGKSVSSHRCWELVRFTLLKCTIKKMNYGTIAIGCLGGATLLCLLYFMNLKI